MDASKRRTARLVTLTLTGAAALNYPVLALFGSDAAVFGVPLLYLYLFACWGLFIALVAVTVESGSEPAAAHQEPSRERAPPP